MPLKVLSNGGGTVADIAEGSSLPLTTMQMCNMSWR